MIADLSTEGRRGSFSNNFVSLLPVCNDCTRLIFSLSPLRNWCQGIQWHVQFRHVDYLISAGSKWPTLYTSSNKNILGFCLYYVSSKYRINIFRNYASCTAEVEIELLRLNFNLRTDKSKAARHWPSVYMGCDYEYDGVLNRVNQSTIHFFKAGIDYLLRSFYWYKIPTLLTAPPLDKVCWKAIDV